MYIYIYIYIYIHIYIYTYISLIEEAIHQSSPAIALLLIKYEAGLNIKQSKGEYLLFSAINKKIMKALP
jgi:hypothetical protein